jgi:hypothetical protein
VLSFINSATYFSDWLDQVCLMLLSLIECGAPCGGSRLLFVFLVHGLTPVAKESVARKRAESHRRSR